MSTMWTILHQIPKILVTFIFKNAMFLRCQHLCVSLFLSGFGFLCVPFIKGTCQQMLQNSNSGACQRVSLFSWCYWYLGLFYIQLIFHLSGTAFRQLFCTYQILSCTGYSLEHRSNLSPNWYFTNLFTVSRYRNVSVAYSPFSRFPVLNSSYLPYQ